jgi:hypothetical protein
MWARIGLRTSTIVATVVLAVGFFVSGRMIVRPCLDQAAYGMLHPSTPDGETAFISGATAQQNLPLCLPLVR